jgi:hypothetical protein
MAYDDQTKAELLALAEERNLEVTDSNTKAEIITALKDAEKASDSGVQQGPKEALAEGDDSDKPDGWQAAYDRAISRPGNSEKAAHQYADTYFADFAEKKDEE